MGFNHRKLISASENIEIHISNDCEFFCDPTRNTDGYCPISCFSECSLACRRPFTPLFRLPPPPPPEPQNKTPNSPILLLVSLSVLAAICFFFCCYSMYKYYKYWDESRNTRRRRSPELQQEETHDQFLDQDRGPVVDHPIWYIRTVGLQPSVINSIDICKYKRGDGLVEGTECSVCLNEFQEDESLRLLPKCNHAFHIPCIDTWLRSHTNCPLCRAGIVGTAAIISTAMPEQSVDDPGVREENQVAISESGGEFSREREDGEMGIEEEAERETDNREKSLETPEEEVAHQPMRRSVSMDSLSASMISLAIANGCPGEISGNSDRQMGNPKESNLGMVPKRVDIDRKLLKLLGDCSISKSLQKQPISMKRSMSCSGKLLFSRSARSRNSIFPL